MLGFNRSTISGINRFDNSKKKKKKGKKTKYGGGTYRNTLNNSIDPHRNLLFNQSVNSI